MPFLTDNLGRVKGRIDSSGNEEQAFDKLGRYKGSYRNGQTFDSLGRYFGNGNLLSSLIDDD